MAVSANFLAYVLDQLSSSGPVRTKRMFGGVGLYRDDHFFGLIDADVVYFKVDESNRSDYVARNCAAFRPRASDPNVVSLNYYAIPSDVLEDLDLIREWTDKAIRVARSAASAKTFHKPRKRAATRTKSKSEIARKF